MYRPIAAVATIILCTWLTGGAVAEPVLLVVNRSEGAVSYVNPTTYEVIETVRVGAGPHEIVTTQDGKFAFISAYENHEEHAIYMLDIPGRQLIDTINLEPNYSPHGLGITSDGKKLFATCERSRTVVEVDIAKRAVRRKYRISEPITHMLVVSKDDKTVYASNIRGDNVAVLNVEKGKVERYIRTGAGCEGIDIKPDGSQVWTANRTQETISIIDTETNRNIKTLESRGYPMRIRFSPDGKIALVSCGKRGVVDVFDTATYESIARIRTTVPPSGIVFDSSGARAFVSHPLDDRVSVIDTEKMEVVEVLEAIPSPDGLAWVD